MHFDITSTNQSSNLEHKIKAKFYKGIHESSKKTRWICLSGLGVGIVSSLLTLAKRIGRISEGVLKGFINIIGSLCFVKSCSFFRGVGMLGRASYQATIRLPLSLISAIFGIFAKTLMFLVDPTNYSHKLWRRHDPIEKNRCKQANAARQVKVADTNFQNAKALIEKDPNDLKNVKFVAKCHLDGIGTPVNEAQAIVYYSIAALTLNDVESMKILGDIAKTNKSYKEWFALYSKAAENGDQEANYKVGMVYLSLNNKEAALPFFLKAIQGGSLIAKQAHSLSYEGGNSPLIPVGELLNLNLQLLKDQTEAGEIGRNLLLNS